MFLMIPIITYWGTWLGKSCKSTQDENITPKSWPQQNKTHILQYILFSSTHSVFTSIQLFSPAIPGSQWTHCHSHTMPHLRSPPDLTPWYAILRISPCIIFCNPRLWIWYGSNSSLMLFHAAVTFISLFQFAPLSAQTLHLRNYAHIPDSKVYGANVGPIWGWQDPGGPHFGPMNLAVCEWALEYGLLWFVTGELNLEDSFTMGLRFVLVCRMIFEIESEMLVQSQDSLLVNIPTYNNCKIISMA